MRRGAVLACVLLAYVSLADSAAAQRIELERAQAASLANALDLERRGNHAEAVGAYLAVLAKTPGDPSALLGLERSLQPLNRSDEILAPARAALAAAPGAAVYGVLVRAYAAAGLNDSARVIVEQWAKVPPQDEAPYREWGTAALRRRDRAGAKAAFELARERLQRGDVLAYEMAQIMAVEGNWAAATGEWVKAMRQLPGYQLTALAALTPAPERTRGEILSALTRDTSLSARRLQAPLMARWGDPMGGLKQLLAALPSRGPEASGALMQLAEQLDALATPAASQARGLALEELARRSVGLAASRARLESARAYSEAGDSEAARRMLGGAAADTSSREVVSGAAATLIGVLIDDGKVEEAERRLHAARAGLGADDYQALNRRVASGWLRAGELERAERALATDSTIEGIAISGRIALFRGDIAGAVEQLREAGPFAGTREEATSRSSLLALLQPIESDSLPELGAALLLLERGDSAAAADAIEAVATGLPIDRGGAELRLLAARVERGAGNLSDAERLLRAASSEAAPSTAPAAELELARLLIELQRSGEAVPLLEHLILTYPTSALVPQARRALDEAKGAVPRT